MILPKPDARRAITPLLCGFLLFILACSAACSPGYVRFDVTPVKGSVKLDSGRAVYVALPADYEIDHDNFESGSGLKTMRAFVKQAKASAHGAVTSATKVQSEAAALYSARAAGCDYMIFMKILDWYDPWVMGQHTEDRGEVTLWTYDVESGEVVRADNLICRGAPTTFNHIGSYAPEDCLAVVFEEWNSVVFQ